jgi:hypothetical protein
MLKHKIHSKTGLRRIGHHPDISLDIEHLLAVVDGLPGDAVLLHEGERHRLYRGSLNGVDCVFKYTQSGKRHQRSLADAFTAAVMLDRGWQPCLPRPLALLEDWQGERVVASCVIYRYAPGRPLSELGADTQLPQIAELMARLAEAGVHSRDFSPANLLLSTENDPPQLLLLDLEALVPRPPSALDCARMIARLRLPGQDSQQLRILLADNHDIAISRPQLRLARSVLLPLRDLNQHSTSRRFRRWVRRATSTG